VVDGELQRLERKKKGLMDTFIRQSSELFWFIAGWLSFLYFIFSISHHIKNGLAIWVCCHCFT